MSLFYNQWNVEFKIWIDDLEQNDNDDLFDIHPNNPLFKSSKNIQYRLQELVENIEKKSKLKSG